MLVNIFKSNQKLVNILAVICTIILWTPTFFIDYEFEISTSFSTDIKWLDISICIFLISFQSIYLNYIVNEHKLVNNNSHLTSLMLLIFNSGCILFLNINQVIIANTFVIIAFHQLLKLYNSKKSFAILFNTSLLISIASIIYFPSATYFVLIWIVLIYTTTPKWRDFIISLIGFSIPITYFVTYKILFDDIDSLLFKEYFSPVFNIQFNQLSFLHQSFFFLFGLISLLAFIKLSSTIRNSVVRVRKMLIVVFLMLVIGMTTLLLNSFDFLATFLLISIPIAIITAIFFQNMKKLWIAELLFLCLISGVFLGYFS
jgi:hypothetical protein